MSQQQFTRTTLTLLTCGLLGTVACAGADQSAGAEDTGPNVFGESTSQEFAVDPAEAEETDATDDVKEQEFGTTGQALLGSDACKNTEIVITNSRDRNGVSTDIKVLKVKYYSASEGKWYTEALSNRVVDYGDTEWWWNQDLAHAENDLLTKWRVHYRYKEADGDWSDQVYQEIDTTNVNCLADMNFYLTVQ